jgi:predicted dehydrogenase
MIFGDQVRRIQSSCVFTPTRVDRQLSIVLQYKDDRMAVLSSTTSGNGESRAVIQGTKGYMVVTGLTNYESITVYGINGDKKASYKRPRQKNAFEYEAAAFAAAMKSGWKECPEIPHAQSASIMHMMDFIRRQLGISYEDIQTSPLPELPHVQEQNVIAAEVVEADETVPVEAVTQVPAEEAAVNEAADQEAAAEPVQDTAEPENRETGGESTGLG